MTSVPSAAANLRIRITECPALEDGIEDRVAAARDRMLPSIAFAHADREPSVGAWLRARAGGRTVVMVGGGIANGCPSSGDDFSIDFPAGARGAALPPGGAISALSQLGSFEQLVLCYEPIEATSPPHNAPQIDDLFALSPERAVAFCVSATPISRSDVQPLLDELSDRIERLQAHAEGRGAIRLGLERAESELRYLERWSGLGFWRLEVWAGGTDESACDAVAGMLSASADLRAVPLQLRTGPEGGDPDTGATWTLARVVGADIVAALLRGPTRELPGIRIAQRPRFDLNPETHGDVRLGDILDATQRPCLPFSVTRKSINRHVFVTGATGSGKSQSIRTLLEQLSELKVPWMVIEPAKSEYRKMAGRLVRLGQQVTVIRPGQIGVPPASLNPLEPSSIITGSPPRREFFRLQTHIDLVRALFTAAFQADEPFPQILAQALTMSYEEQGWNVALGRATSGDCNIRPRMPTLADLQRCARAAVDAVEYGAEVRNNVRGFVDVRLGSLRLGTPGRFFEDGHPLDLESLLKRNVVFEIEDLGDDNDKAFFIGNVLVRLIELLRLYEQHEGSSSDLRHVIVIEEAHRLLRNVSLDSAAGHAVTMFGDMLAEIRAYGEGVVVAEQIPAKIIPDVIKNSAVKLVHRLPSIDDRTFVGATMNLDERQSEAVIGFAPGIAAAHSDGMDHAVLVAIDGRNQANEHAGGHLLPPMRVRSSGCPQECSVSACTLDDLVESTELAREPAFIIWTEIVTLAHLMGEPLGTLVDPFRASLMKHDARRLRCSIGLGSTRACKIRARSLRRWYDVFALEKAVAEAMAAQIEAEVDLGRPSPTWQVARFRWADIRRHLDAEEDAIKTAAAPYPVPSEWTRRGLDLGSGTWQEVRSRLKVIDSANDTEFVATFLGSPAALDEATASLSSQPARGVRLNESLKSIMTLPKNWPAYRLYPANERKSD